jgi:hypothetical protein
MMISRGESIAIQLAEFEKHLRKVYREGLEDPERRAATEAKIQNELEVREKQVLGEWISRSSHPASW